MLDNQFYTINDSAISAYHQLPKFLFQGKYKELLQSNDRLLYSVLKSMTMLSLQHNDQYSDEAGRIFFYLNQQDIASETCLSVSTVGRSLKALEAAGLIYKIQHRNSRSGNFSVCRYYLLKPVVDTSDSTVGQIDERSDVKLTDGGTSICHTNNIYNNNNNNNLSIYPDDKIDRIDKVNIDMLTKLLNRHVDWDSVEQAWGSSKASEIRNCILDVLASTNDTIRIAGNTIDSNYVKSRFLALRTEHILEVLISVAAKGNSLSNPLGYLKTCLYNITSTLSLQAVGQELYNMNLEEGV